MGPEASCDHASIQAALADGAGSAAGDEVRVSLSYSHSGMVTIGGDLTLRGGFESCRGQVTSDRSALYAPPMDPLFVLEAGHRLELLDLRLVGDNSGPRDGGVIRMQPGRIVLVLDDVLIENGNAVRGGAIFMAGDGNRLEMNETQIAGNTAVTGGGVYCARGAELSLHSGRIEGNSATLAGGGIYVEAGCNLPDEPNRLSRVVADNHVTSDQFGYEVGVELATAGSR